MKKIIVVFLLLNGLLLHAQQPAFITDSLDSYIQREMKRWQIPGLAIAIVKGDKIVATKKASSPPQTQPGTHPGIHTTFVPQRATNAKTLVELPEY